MTYSQSLADRVRLALRNHRGITDKKMFGGCGFLLNGNMLVGVWRDNLVVRFGPEGYEDALLKPHVKEFDITGRPMKGWIMVDLDGLESDRQLVGWIDRAMEFVETLPPKK